VAGPLLDLFFVRTDLPRHRVVATKAATQVMAHAVKIAFWGGILLDQIAARDRGGEVPVPPLWLFAAVAPLSILGTWLGSRVLEKMSDTTFRVWTRWIVTVMGVIYLGQGLAKLLA